MRIGILGGTFDPVHKGHLSLARSALKELKLDRLFFVPAKISPLKQTYPMAASTHRVNMLRIALKKMSRCKISRMEINRRGPSYTVDTLRAFRKKFSGSELFLVMGSDALKDFKRWKNWRGIVNLSCLAVGKRPKFQAPKEWNQKALWLKGRFPDLSSTEIRSALSEGKTRGVFAGALLNYIHGHKLYVPEQN